MMHIRGLHHSACRCRNSEEMRTSYEDFLGLSLVNAFAIAATKAGR
jgi:catechol 2,3-dioxygenase-like lactoylglutathione lyase family enzyme